MRHNSLVQIYANGNYPYGSSSLYMVYHLYGQFCLDKTADHIYDIQCTRIKLYINIIYLMLPRRVLYLMHQQCKPWNRKPDLEVLFIPCLMLRFPPILAGV